MIIITKTYKQTLTLDDDAFKEYLYELIGNVGYESNGVDGWDGLMFYLDDDFDSVMDYAENKSSENTIKVENELTLRKLFTKTLNEYIEEHKDDEKEDD